MASQTPTSAHKRSTSRGRSLSRPTTPLRPPSRSSLRDSTTGPHAGRAAMPLEGLEPAFAELSDSMADLEANFIHLQLMQESLARFNENFASFLYGMNMNAFCVDFSEAPIPESFKRQINHSHPIFESLHRREQETDTEATFLTTDTSFVENPPSSKPASKFSTPASRSTRGSSSSGAAGGGGGGIPTRGGRSLGRGGRPSGIARGPSTRGRGRGRGRAA